MKQTYEEQKWKASFWCFSISFLCVIGGISYYMFEKTLWKSVLLVLLCSLFIVLIYCIMKRNLNKVYKDIEEISDRMIQVVERDVDYSEEVFKEGVLGNLYTNFYKMVSVLKESELQTKQEKLFLRDIISDISHQLKTPLASLNVFVDLLYNDKLEDEESKKKILAEAQNQLNRMEWMVLSLLKLARIEAGAVLFKKESRQVTDILNNACESVSYLTKQRNQRVRISETKAEILCDGEWLTEAVINLLKNASDYSEAGTEICIEVEDTDLITRIAVCDQGMGIPDEAIPHIFERFYRVNHEVNPNSVGIGLPLAKSIVEGMDGQIAVRSKVGEYTHFIVTFVK